MDLIAIHTDYAEELLETSRRLGIKSRIFLVSDPQESTLSPKRSSDSLRNSKCVSAEGAPRDRAFTVDFAFSQECSSFGKLVDPSAQISSTAELGCGVFVNTLAVVSSGTKVGCHSNLNRLSSIGHHASIGPFASIGPGAVICSEVQIGFGTRVAAGAVILPKVRIGSNVVVGAGSVVTKDIPDNIVAFGNPANFRSENSLWEGITVCPVCL
jgi:sugar O-acyltransferase (sialic acid O-acetyltransferase NeuD family)